MTVTGPAITIGYDYNFFKKITVSSGGFAPNCDLLIPFSTYTITFQLESGGPVEYSFNGNTVHGDMTVGLSSQNLTFENRVVSKIWFKGSGVVRVEAWAIR